MDAPDLVSQTAEFLRYRREETSERNKEGRAFRIGMAAIATAGAAKALFGRRGA